VTHKPDPHQDTPSSGEQRAEPPVDPRNEPRFMFRPKASWPTALLRPLRQATRLLFAELRLGVNGARCPVCSSQNLDPLVVADRPPMLVCGRCRVVFRHPRPSTAELRAHYEQANRTPGAQLSPDEVALYKKHRDSCYNSIGLVPREQAIGRPRRALDVGCGNGLNMQVLAGRGWEVEGVDPNAAQVASLVSAGSTALIADLAQACEEPWRDARYQLVSMLHVLEHLSDPLESISSLAPLLTPMGLLVLETPLCCDLTNRDHLFFFTGTSLYLLLEKAGFAWQSHLVYTAHGYAHDNILVLAQRTY
jgi:SAM-dependent methyltransferase